MKKLLVALALSFPLFVGATELSLQLHGFSWHASAELAPKKEGRWNESNFGVGMRAQFNEDFAVQAGYYRNSMFKDTFYAVVNYTPVHIGRVALGVFGGPASGYNVPVVGGAMMNVNFDQSVLTLRVIPEIKNTTPSVIAVEYGMKF